MLSVPVPSLRKAPGLDGFRLRCFYDHTVVSSKSRNAIIKRCCSKMLRDGLVFKDEDGQIIFNQYSFCELVKHLLVELVGISYEEASQIVDRSPLAEPVADAMGVAMFSHDLPYYWAMFFYYGNGYWQKGIPAQPEDMDAYEALENKIMEKYDLKEPFIWT